MSRVREPATAGRMDRAEPLLQETYPVLASSMRHPPRRLHQVLERMSALSQARGDSAQAATWRLKVMDLTFPTDPFAPLVSSLFRSFECRSSGPWQRRVQKWSHDSRERG